MVCTFFKELSSPQSNSNTVLAPGICTGVRVDQFLERLERLTDWKGFKGLLKYLGKLLQT